MYSFRFRGRRLTKALALAVAGVAIGAPAAQAEEFIPGVTDFPSRMQTKPKFVPGVTDFPSRLGAKAEQAARARIARAEASQSPSIMVVDTSFDWGAAGIGAAIGAGGMLLAAVALRSRPRTRLVRAES